MSGTDFENVFGRGGDDQPGEQTSRIRPDGISPPVSAIVVGVAITLFAVSF
jgi:hypothetical protein